MVCACFSSRALDLGVALEPASSDSTCKLLTHHNSHTVSSTGYLSLTGVQLLAPAGSTCVIRESVTPTQSRLPAPVASSLDVVNCPPGYEQLSTGACSMCPEEKYNINGDGVCHSCSTGVHCPGGADLSVAADHWALVSASGIVEPLECAPAFCCQSAECSLDDMCAPFREGPLCSVCADGRTDVAGACVACEGVNWDVLMVLFLACLVVMAVFIIASFETRSPLLTQVGEWLLLLPRSDSYHTDGTDPVRCCSVLSRSLL